MKKIATLTCLVTATMLGAQTVNTQRIVTYEEFIKNVREKNIEYIVERYNVSIAEANTQAAKVMPDPEFSFGYENNQDRTIQMGQVYALYKGICS
jgi:cobalt-zinc-cadmium efflux system outer membrane protein